MQRGARYLIHACHPTRSNEVLPPERKGPVGQEANRIDWSLWPRGQLAIVVTNSRHAPELTHKQAGVKSVNAACCHDEAHDVGKIGRRRQKISHNEGDECEQERHQLEQLPQEQHQRPPAQIQMQSIVL
eukprot:3704177-Prymnesium_polylepis.2